MKRKRECLCACVCVHTCMSIYGPGGEGMLQGCCLLFTEVQCIYRKLHNPKYIAQCVFSN